MFKQSNLLLILSLLALILAACGTTGNEASEATAVPDNGEASEVTAVPDNDEMDETTNDSATVAASSSSVVDTGQGICYDDSGDSIACPTVEEIFYGQDAQYTSAAFNFTDNGDGTITDNVTNLVWQQTPDSNPYSWADAQSYCEDLSLADSDDWRTPSLKELFSISDFESGWPYLDLDYFDLITGGQDKSNQYWASNYYEVATDEAAANQAFGVNHATGHIKAYPDGGDGGGGPASKYVRCVQGDDYLVNDFADNGDGTITDNATGLMWLQDDNGEGVDWESALAYADGFSYAGYDDWRVPDVKELQSIVDYSGVYPAIDPSYFNITDADAYFWTSTSAFFSPNTPGYYYAWYVAFGYAVGADGEDSHGAGAVRFDTKVEGGPAGEDPERIYNYVRLVRGGDVTETPDGDPTADDSVEFVESSDQPEGTGGTEGTGEEQDSEGGPPNEGPNRPEGGAPSREQPDFAAVAAQLGITEEELMSALGDPSEGPPDFAAAAETLGVTEQELMDALGITEGEIPPRDRPPEGQPPTATP